MSLQQDGIVYAELLLKKPRKETSPLPSSTEYAEIVYVNSSPSAAESPPVDKKS